MVNFRVLYFDSIAHTMGTNLTSLLKVRLVEKVDRSIIGIIESLSGQLDNRRTPSHSETRYLYNSTRHKS